MPRGQWSPRRSLYCACGAPRRSLYCGAPHRILYCVTLDDAISVDSPLSNGSDSGLRVQKLPSAGIGSSCCVGSDDEEPDDQECTIVPDLKTILWTLSGLCAFDESSDDKGTKDSTNAILATAMQ
mmetsp:Transcript_22315/g.52691  ORF Transcript_22315/g.52691 Transcript_22315/m.52691 type:complete len:125 (+) Transcript_22315:248-622(+)